MSQRTAAAKSYFSAMSVGDVMGGGESSEGGRRWATEITGSPPAQPSRAPADGRGNSSRLPPDFDHDRRQLLNLVYAYCCYWTVMPERRDKPVLDDSDSDDGDYVPPPATGRIRSNPL